MKKIAHFSRLLGLVFSLGITSAAAQTAVPITGLPNGGLMQSTDTVAMVRNGITMKAQPYIWPANKNVMISNGTSAPLGVAPINGNCLVGSAGQWISAACGGLTGGTGITISGGVVSIDPTPATAALNVFTSSLKGLVPASGGGTTNYLRADGTWAPAAGAGTITLISDVTGSSTSPVTTTVAAIQGQPVAGTTGTGNVTFSINPTFIPTWANNSIGLNITPPTVSSGSGNNFTALNVGGVTASGTVGASNYYGLNVAGPSVSGGSTNFTNIVGANIAGPALTSSASTNIKGLNISGPTLSSATATFSTGLFVANQGASGIFHSYGIFIDTQSGSTINDAINYNGLFKVDVAGNVTGANLSGTNTGDQIVPANTTATGSQWFSAYNSTTGVFTKSQPAFSDISGSFTLAQFPTIATNTVLANVTGGTAVPTAISRTQLTALSNVFTSSLPGDVPASGGGSTNYLRADGTWTAPAGAGTVTTTGTPLIGQLTQFSGSTSITNGNLSGDVTTGGSLATTLATVNSNVGSFGSSTSIPSFTVNGKGLITAASGNAVIAPAGTLTGATLASGVTASSLTSVGTIVTGVWQGTAVDATHGGTAQTSWALGDTLYSSATNTLSKLTGNTSATKNFLVQTGTGSVSAAPAWGTIASGDVPTLNQNTTGSAAKWTTARNLAGNSVDGSADVAFSNKFIVQGTADTGLSGAQFMGALGTGIVKNTTTTGVQSIATAGTDYQAPITLTTTGTSGAATFISNTLNIPNYAGGGGGGTVTTTGTPASGNLTAFSGSTSITNSNLSGDITTSGTLATTLATVNSTVGTFNGLTVNGKGLVTNAVFTNARSVTVATTAALTATYSNGTGGVGATLTNSGTQAALSIDGVALSLTNRVLVWKQGSTFQNGIYTVTTVGSGATNWVLTRATDFDNSTSGNVFQGATVPVTSGTTQAAFFFIETGAGPFTIGTTPIIFTPNNAGGGGSVTSVSNTDGTAIVTPTTGAVIVSSSGIAPNGDSSATIDVRNATYGAIPDAKKLIGCTVTSGAAALTCTTGAFITGDVGKSIKIYDIGNAAYVFRGTISARSSGTAITLSGNATATCTSTNCIAYYGTDNATAINAALAAAATMANNSVNDPNFPKGAGAPRVVFPIDSRGDGYLFNSTLTTVCCNVVIDADAMLFSNTGNSATDRTWALNLAQSTHIKHLVMEVGGGMGVNFGSSSSVNASSKIDDLQIWTVGTNFNGALTPPSQTGLEITGYDYEIKKYWVKGGNIGFAINQASDVFVDQLEIIGASSGLVDTSGENVHISNLVCDTNSFVCASIDGARTSVMNIRAFSVTSTTLTNGLQIGTNDPTDVNRGLVINYTAQRTGGTGASLANLEDSTINLNLTNSALYSASGGNMTTGIAYGTGNVGSLDVTMNRDGAISTAFTGTVVGNLRDISDGVISTYNASKAAGTALFAGAIPTLANGNGSVGASSTLGGLFTGQGSTNDFTFQNKSGSTVCATATGATTLNCTGLQVGGTNVLTANQSISLTGDVTGSGTTGIATTLATVNSNVGSFTSANITVNAKGLITAASNGSGGSGSSNSRAITQTNSLTACQVVRFNGTNYVTAQADSAADAEVVGMVSATGNPFTLTTDGYVTGCSGLTAGTTYFLDPTTPGALTSTQPTTATQVSKPVFIADSTTTGYFTNYRGQLNNSPHNYITKAGNATLVGGTVTVSTPLATATCVIMISNKTAGGSVGSLTYTVSAGTSFTVSSSNPLDTSTVSYTIIEP